MAPSAAALASEDDVENDEEMTELLLLEKKRKLYDWKKTAPEYKERLNAIKHKYKPVLADGVGRKRNQQMHWGSDKGLTEITMKKCSEFLEAKESGQLDKLSKLLQLDGIWQNDPITRGTDNWRRFQLIDDGKLVAYARMVKMEDGSMLIQEGRPRGDATATMVLLCLLACCARLLHVLACNNL